MQGWGGWGKWAKTTDVQGEKEEDVCSDAGGKGRGSSALNVVQGP